MPKSIAATPFISNFGRILEHRLRSGYSTGRGNDAQRAVRAAQRSARRERVQTSRKKPVQSKSTQSGPRVVPAYVGRTGRGTIGSSIKTGRIKKTRARTIGKKGLMYQKKSGGTTDTQEQLFIGHATCPLRLFIEHTWRTLAKEVMTRAQADITSCDTPIDILFPGDAITVWYQTRQGANMLSDTMTLNPADTINTIGLWLSQDARGFNNEGTAGAANDQTIFHAISYAPKIIDGNNQPSVAVYLPLKGARVKWSAQSDLKMQNRTVDQTLDKEITDIDNVPLYGETYEGKGTGATYILQPTVTGAVPTFCADTVTGLIALAPGTSYKAPTFLPDPTQFDKVNKCGKFNVAPGEIRNSKLKFTGSMLFNDWYLATHPSGVAVTTLFRSKLGSFRFVGIQKKLHYAASDSNIQTVYELEYKLSMDMTFARKSVSCTVYQEDFDNNITSAP